LGLDDRTADRETQPHALTLRRDERLEQAARNISGEPWSRVGNRNLNEDTFKCCSRKKKLAPLTVGHCLDRIAYEIDKNLLNLNSVNEYQWEVRGNLQRYSDAERYRANQGKGTRVLNHRADVLCLSLCLTGSDEFAQSMNDPPCALHHECSLGPWQTPPLEASVGTTSFRSLLVHLDDADKLRVEHDAQRFTDTIDDLVKIVMLRGCLQHGRGEEIPIAPTQSGHGGSRGPHDCRGDGTDHRI
jgi:hypothetical protein